MGEALNFEGKGTNRMGEVVKNYKGIHLKHRRVPCWRQTPLTG